MKKLLLFTGVISMFVVLNSCLYNKYDATNPVVNTGCDTAKTISYKNDVMPVLTSYCTSCHKSGGSAFELGVYKRDSLYSANGRLVSSITWDDIKTKKHMPQGSSSKIPDCKIGIVSKWVKSGFPNN